jgi:hypothetical protein
VHVTERYQLLAFTNVAAGREQWSVTSGEFSVAAADLSMPLVLKPPRSR